MANLQSVLSLQNSDLAKGQITDGDVTADIVANDQISHADDYKPTHRRLSTTARPSILPTSPMSSTPCKTFAPPAI